MGRTGEFIILGCGGSGGVPLITGYWGNCDPENPKNKRTRASAAVRLHDNETYTIIDTGPDIHQQIQREKITSINSIIYTHAHSDHVNGIDDVRYAAIHKRINGQDDAIIPIYADMDTLAELKECFAYMFRISNDGLYIPLIEPYEIEIDKTFTTNNGIPFLPIKQTHGSGQSIGYKIGDLTYSTDVSALDDYALDVIKGTKTWIVDCGQFSQDQTTVHANFDDILRWQDIVQAEKIYLTHLTPRDDYDAVNENTPDYIECAYDGLKIPFIMD